MSEDDPRGATGPDSPRLSRLVVAALVAAGVRHVVVAPGSRNAPLALAGRRGAEDSRLTLHVRIDERSAGFLALGIARSTGTPVAVITTSGTAVGNLFPAVLEADESGVPLVVVSADRPVRLVGSGSNQTTRQQGLFGLHVRDWAGLSSHDAPEAAVAAIVGRLVHEALGTRSRTPGPVQLNVELDAPLVAGVPEPALPVLELPRLTPVAPGEPVVLPGGPLTVVVAGDADPRTGAAARDLAEQARWPLFAEPSSNARGGQAAIAGYRLLLRSTDLGGRIERVVVFGRPTLSRPVQALLARDGVELIVVSDRAGWVDPGFRAAVVADRVRLADDYAPDEKWLTHWLVADHVLRIRIDLLVASLPAPRRPLGLEIADLVVERVGPGQVLVLGASSPIRDADLARIPDRGPARVLSQRGLSGIDGTISAAVGAALGTGLPVTALLGDLTAIHDTGGLWLGDLEERPSVRLVVVDDRGGAIFHTLEQGGLAHADSFERVFGTPHGVDIAQVARGFGWQAATVDDLGELGARLRIPPTAPEVLLVPAERASRRRLETGLAGL